MNTNVAIIIPVYNEADVLGSVIRSVLKHFKYVICVNDGSKDNSEKIIKEHIRKNKKSGLIYKYISKENGGKGSAIREGIKKSTGHIIIVQDADLEYNPEEYAVLLQPVLDGFADVVYGSRFMGGNAHRVLFFWHTIGNRFLTFLSNMFTNLNLTDKGLVSFDLNIFSCIQGLIQ